MNQISFLKIKDIRDALNIKQLNDHSSESEIFFASNYGKQYYNLALRRHTSLVGFLITQIISNEATLFSIMVHPKCHRQGLGQQLLQHLIYELKHLNITTLWLEVRASNKSAIALYKKLNFNEIYIRDNYYPIKHGRENAIIMACTLNP